MRLTIEPKQIPRQWPNSHRGVKNSDKLIFVASNVARASYSSLCVSKGSFCRAADVFCRLKFRRLVVMLDQ